MMNQKQPKNAWTTVAADLGTVNFYFSKNVEVHELLKLGTYVWLRFRATRECLVVDVWDESHEDAQSLGERRVKVVRQQNPDRPLRIQVSRAQLPEPWRSMKEFQSHLCRGRGRGHQELLIDRDALRDAPAAKPHRRRKKKTEQEAVGVKARVQALREAVVADTGYDYFCRVEGRDVPWNQVTIIRCPVAPQAEEL